ncbi:MAG: dephospho-CoA kinase [Salinispira sp.]
MSYRRRGDALPVSDSADLPVVGITGPYCSGKSVLSELLRKQGWLHIEVDAIGHAALEAQKNAIVEAFSSSIIDRETGKINRRKLGHIVFSDPSELSRLEALVHPVMFQQVREIIDQRRSPCRNTGRNEEAPKINAPKADIPLKGILINAAILYKMKLETLCSLVFWVQAPRFIRLWRAWRRDGLNRKQIRRRFSAADELSSQLLSSHVDMYKVDNIFMRTALRRMEDILKAESWVKTKST